MATVPVNGTAYAAAIGDRSVNGPSAAGEEEDTEARDLQENLDIGENGSVWELPHPDAFLARISWILSMVCYRAAHCGACQPCLFWP